MRAKRPPAVPAYIQEQANLRKLAAARALGLAVILLRRPALPEAPTVETVEDAVTWLDHARALPIERGV